MKRPILHNVNRLALLAIVSMATVAVAAPRSQCWMTGGGSIFSGEYGGDPRITHGFELDCSIRRSDNLQVNDHGTGWRFHLGDVTSAICIDDPNIVPNPPGAQFDTYIGQGTGICRNVGGQSVNCWAEWIFTDGGEVGGCLRDTATITVYENFAPYNVLIQITGDVDCGNHQAHSK